MVAQDRSRNEDFDFANKIPNEMIQSINPFLSGFAVETDLWCH